MQTASTALTGQLRANSISRGYHGLTTIEEVQVALFEGARDRTTRTPQMQAILAGEGRSSGADWQFDDDAIIGVDASGTAVRNDMTLEVPDVSWSMGVGCDPENQLVWGITLGAEGYLYEYEITADRWLAWGMKNYDAGANICDSDTSALITTPGSHLGRNYLIMSRRANAVSSISIPTEAYPGLVDTFDPGNGPSPRFMPLAVDGDVIVVRAIHRRGQLTTATPSLIYLVNLTDGPLDLVR